MSLWQWRSLALVVFLLGGPDVARGRQRSEISVDVSLFSGTLAYSWPTASGRHLGVALGGGVDVLDATLLPANGRDLHERFDQYLHLSAFVRGKPTERWEWDGGIRLGLGELGGRCRSSNCWLGTFAGVYGGFFWGGRRIKLGHRLMGALLHQGGQAEFVLHVDLLAARLELY